MLAILLTLIFSIPQETKIVTCTVVEPDKSVACPESGKMVLITFTDKDDAKQIFDEWRLLAPMRGESVNSDAPLYQTPLLNQQEVKAIIDGNKLIPVASCKVRVWRNLKEYTLNHPGELVPFGLRTEPDDCQPWYGKN